MSSLKVGFTYWLETKSIVFSHHFLAFTAMNSSRPNIGSNDPATRPDSALATYDFDSSSGAPPIITPDTSPKSKYQASNEGQNALYRTVVVIPAAATRYLQSHPFWIERGIQIQCSLSTDVLSVKGKLHPIMRVCARSEDYQYALRFAKALTNESRFRTVVVLGNDEEAEEGDRGESRGGDAVRQTRTTGSPYDVVETEEGVVYLEFHEKGEGRTDKGVSDGAGNEGTGSGSWSGSGGGQGDDVDGDIDRGGEGEGKGGSGSEGGGGRGSAVGGGGSGSAFENATGTSSISLMNQLVLM